MCFLSQLKIFKGIMKLISRTFVHKMFYILQGIGSWPIFAAGEKEMEPKDLSDNAVQGLLKRCWQDEQWKARKASIKVK